MLTERQEYLGIRYATKTEVKNFQQVEKALSEEEIDIIYDVIDDEPLENLLHNKIENKTILNILNKHNITHKAFCDWYFTELED